MKSEVLPLLALVLVSLCCQEISIGGYGDCFNLKGKTFDSSDSTILTDVNIQLTDFQGHLESPIDDKYFYSDTLGVFDVGFCPGYKKVQKGDEITVFKLDSCKVIFSINGYENDTITHYQSDTTSVTTINVYMNKN
jgi:hypothetical protein